MSKWETFRKQYALLDEYEQEMVRIFVKILDLNKEMKTHFGHEVDRVTEGGKCDRI